MAPYIWHLTYGTLHMAPYIWHLTYGTLHMAPYIHLISMAPYILKTLETPAGLQDSDSNSLDSLELPFQIKTPGIRRLEIENIGSLTGAGMGFDNFRATTVSPTPPTLAIEPAILLKFESELGEIYTIEESVNLQDWLDTITDIEGDGTELKFFSSKEYFRGGWNQGVRHLRPGQLFKALYRGAQRVSPAICWWTISLKFPWLGG